MNIEKIIEANTKIIHKNYEEALHIYEEQLTKNPELENIIGFNLDFARKKLGKFEIQSNVNPTFFDRDLSNKFDADFYLEKNDDVRKSKMDPEAHYWQFGEQEGRWPNRFFDPIFYLKVNADVRVAGVSPFAHYKDHGFEERRPTFSIKASREDLILSKPILFVGHDGILAGAQVVLLEIIKWFYFNTARKIKLVLMDPGPMTSEYIQYCDVYVLSKARIDRDSDFRKFIDENFEFVYLNTVVAGGLLESLDEHGLRKGVKKISHIHEMENVISQYHREFVALKKDVFHWISASPASTDALINKFSVDSVNISTVPAFIKPIVEKVEQSEKYKNIYREKYLIDKKSFVVVGCGTVNDRKGPDIFVETAKKIFERNPAKDIVFFWIGDGPDLEKIKSGLTDSELKKVIFPGKMRNANEVLAIGDAFFLSSREDPFPLVVMEAAQHSIPSLCFAPCTGITEFVKNDAGVSLPELNSDGAADVIQQWEEDRDHLTKLGQKAFERVFKEYSADKRILDIYSELYVNNAITPAVSIIVPFYNHEKFAIDRIKSIENQGFKDFEAIILDDCSTDSTLDVVKLEIPDHRFKVFGNQKNSGSPFAQWEKGVQLALAEIVWVAEGDDSCDSNFLEVLTPYFNDPILNIASARTQIIDENGVISEGALNAYLDRAYTEKFNRSYINDGYIEVNQNLGVMCTLVNASGLLIRKSSLGDSLISAKKFKMCGDWLIYLNCLKHGKISYDITTSNYFRRHSSSQVHKIEGTPLYFSERESICNFIAENFYLKKSTLERMKYEVHNEWKRFEYKNQKSRIEDFFDENFLDKNVNIVYPNKNIAFYVHGMLFSNGGIERVASELANRFSEIGWTVTIYCRVHSNTKPVYPLYKSVRVKPIFDENNIDESARNLRKEILKDEVEVFIPMLSEWIFDPIVDAVSGLGVKVIASEHNDPWKIEDLWWSHEKRIQCFSKVDKVHLLLEKYRESLPIELLEKVKVIPNGVEIPKLEDIRFKREKVILSVGRLASQKRFDRLILAISSVREKIKKYGFEVHIYGEGPLRFEYEKMINDLNLSDVVKLKGVTDKINEKYMAADIFVLPSEFEGLPMTLLEAFSYGMPAVCYKECNGPNEIIENGKNGFLVESEVEFGKRIIDLIELDKDGFRESAFSRSLSYSKDSFCNNWIDLIREI